MATISVSLSDQEMQSVFAPSVIRLAQADWFCGRVSSCALFAHAYARSREQKERLRRKFIDLCQEDTPMIKRAVASKVGEFSVRLEKQHLIKEIMPIFHQLSQDE